MGYHIDEQIEARVLPTLKKLNKRNCNDETFSNIIKSWFNNNRFDPNDDRLKLLVLHAMFEEQTFEPRVGVLMNEIFNVLNDNYSLLELKYVSGTDIITEEFGKYEEYTE